MPLFRTVLGDLDPGELGRIDYHEHLFQISPLLVGDELDDEEATGAEAALLRTSGFAAMVDATPIGLGRNPAAMARISAHSGLNVVATSGAHSQEHYQSSSWMLDLSEGEMTARFITDLTTGMPACDRPSAAPAAQGPDGEPVRAGILKVGIGYWRISPFERRVIAAVGAAHCQTGSPVMVHLEHGSAAFEVLAVLATVGVPAESVVLAHVDRNPDPVLHAELAAAGAYLGYDGFARTREWPDTALLRCLREAADLGARDRLLIGGDVARRTRYTSYGGMPGLAYLGDRVVPRLEREAPADLVAALLVHNPARLLTFRQLADACPERDDVSTSNLPPVHPMSLTLSWVRSKPDDMGYRQT